MKILISGRYSGKLAAVGSQRFIGCNGRIAGGSQYIAEKEGDGVWKATEWRTSC